MSDSIIDNGTLYIGVTHAGTVVSADLLINTGALSYDGIPVTQVVLASGASVSYDPAYPQVSRPYAGQYDDEVFVNPGTTFDNGLFIGDAPGGQFIEYLPAGSLIETIEFIQCLVAGTPIATPDGPRAIETLIPGDLIWCHRTGQAVARPVRSCRSWRGDAAPIRVTAGAIADGVPDRDVLLSADHAVFIDGVLIPARHLLNGASIRRQPGAGWHYCHLQVADHDLMIAGGLPVETLLPVDRAMRERAAQLWDAYGCAPLVVAGPALDRIRHCIASRQPAPAIC